MSHYRWFWTIVSSDFIVRNDRARKSFNIVSNKAKGRISKRVFQENKARQIFRKTNISYPWHAYIRVSGRKICSFFGKFGELCFLEISVLRFALLPYYWRNVVLKMLLQKILKVQQGKKWLSQRIVFSKMFTFMNLSPWILFKFRDDRVSSFLIWTNYFDNCANSEKKNVTILTKTGPTHFVNQQ